MSYEERSSNRHFRTSMDIGMGLFYMLIGGFVFIVKNFGSTPIPAWLAYLLGGMMMIGGGARFYRGMKAVWPKKNDNNRQGI